MADQPPRKGILDQLLEEAMAKGAETARESDFAVDLETSDSDGTHRISGVPLSKVGKGFLARFGITSDNDEGGEGDGGSGSGKDAGGKDAGKPVTLKDYFGGKKAAG